MNEHGFIKAIHRHLHPDVHKWKIHDTYTGGVPDAMYSGPAGVLFVEYKYIKKLPKKDDTILRSSLSPLQVQWLERMKVSAKAALILGAEDTALIIVDDFSANISKMNYIELCITKSDVALWIFKATHMEGFFDGTYKTTNSCSKSKEDLAAEKN